MPFVLRQASRLPCGPSQPQSRQAIGSRKSMRMYLVMGLFQSRANCTHCAVTTKPRGAAARRGFGSGDRLDGVLRRAILQRSIGCFELGLLLCLDFPVAAIDD